MTAAVALPAGLPQVDGADQRRLSERLAPLDERAAELRRGGLDVHVAECQDGWFRIVPRSAAGRGR